MSSRARKRDRTARLLKLQVLLWQYPHGIEVDDIAQKLSISKRTIYRDLLTLENELDVPIWEQGSKRGVVEGYFLPPVTFTLAEATNIFLSARLMQNYSCIYNPNVVATFIKLNTILPPHLRDQIQHTLDYLEKLPRDERKLKNFNALTEAWASRRRVTIKYSEPGIQDSTETTIEPYFIEPSLLSFSSYVIAYCHLKKTIRSFKTDHIVGDIKISPDTYEIPASFNAMDYLSSPWDITSSDKLETHQAIETVKLRFSPKISRSVGETVWHPSQETEVQSDGSMVMTLKTRNTLSFRTWIMRWEKEVEVLEPRSLRDQIAKMVRSLAAIYSDPKRKNHKKSSHYKRAPLKEPPVKNDAELTDEQWKRIAPLLPSQARTGRPRYDDRQLINGILYVIKNSAKWSDIPRTYGAPSTCFTRLQHWKKQGIWENIRQILDSPEKITAGKPSS